MADLKNKTIMHEYGKQAVVITAEDLNVSPDNVQGVSIEGFSIAVRALLQNWRQGTVACKDRSQVTSRSNKKPWKQKGTGRARAGSPRSPLWRGGGVIFGPQPRTRTLVVSKAVKKNALKGLFLQQLFNGKIVALDWQLEGDIPKTAQAYKALKQAGLHTKKLVFFVDYNDYVTQASFANLANVSMLLYDQPNAYALADGECWVFLQKDNNVFKDMVSAWL